jgi:hypothetical protein
MSIGRTLVFVTWLLALGCAAAQELTQFKLPQPCAGLNRQVMNQTANGQLKEAESALDAVLASGASDLGAACAGLILSNLAAFMCVSGRFAEAEAFSDRSICLKGSWVLKPRLCCGHLRPSRPPGCNRERSEWLGKRSEDATHPRRAA